MQRPEPVEERHPADTFFLPEVDGRDGGYLFVTEELDRRSVSVYRWEPSRGLEPHGRVGQGLPDPGPNLLFLDRVGRRYYLGVASYHWGWGALTAWDTELFTGTHHVETSGLLLLSSSSYRWARDEGPGDADDVSRVDECPSAVEVSATGETRSSVAGASRCTAGSASLAAGCCG